MLCTDALSSCALRPGLRSASVPIWLAALLAGVLGSLPVLADSRYGDSSLPEAVRAELRALLPQRPGVVDTYAVIVGGDAGDEVFRKEAIAVRAALDSRLSTRGRSLILLNHRSLPAPDATYNSIKEVLKVIGQQMNPDEDVLWLHLASHGGHGGNLVLSYPGRPLYWLTGPHLRRMLDEAHIRYRVIVVSACYSGGFVAPLASPETLIATASAASRRSYGCGNASDITEFSRALYLKAFPKSPSVLEAMRLAQQLVHEEEGVRDTAHSYPQVRSGMAIEVRLRGVAVVH